MNSQIDTADGRNQNGTKMVARSAHMPSITLKNIPEDLYLRLKASAERNRRSINSEAIVCLEGALKPAKLDPVELIARIHELNKDVKSKLTSDEIVQMIRADREDPNR